MFKNGDDIYSRALEDRLAEAYPAVHRYPRRYFYRSVNHTHRLESSLRLRIPLQLIQMHRVLEATQPYFAAVGKHESFARRQLPHDVRQHDLAAPGLIGDTGCEDCDGENESSCES